MVAQLANSNAETVGTDQLEAEGERARLEANQCFDDGSHDQKGSSLQRDREKPEDNDQADFGLEHAHQHPEQRSAGLAFRPFLSKQFK